MDSDMMNGGPKLDEAKPRRKRAVRKAVAIALVRKAVRKRIRRKLVRKAVRRNNDTFVRRNALQAGAGFP